MKILVLSPATVPSPPPDYLYRRKQILFLFTVEWRNGKSGGSICNRGGKKRT
jgi:hypothetical protein